MRNQENSCFTCQNCQEEVKALTNGSYRNHCPFCLYSLHVDVQPGDRQNQCHGLMMPTDYRYHSKKGYQLKHQCLLCKKDQWNKIAEQTEQADCFIDWLTNR